ncbi:MAG TPA: DUF2017 family protein [Actinomycetota bacterium]|nr:DUF2017 family protein [Actinomycetota bacterium]
MAEFEKAHSGIRVQLEEHEADLLRQLLWEMATLLEVDIRDDPVNKRLFPDAYESKEDSESYRELVGDELRTAKVDTVKKVLQTLGEQGPVDTTIPKEDVGDWLTVLTDIRLAIGTRNEVTEEKMAEELDPDDPEAAAMLVLHWLGWLQESLLETLL